MSSKSPIWVNENRIVRHEMDSPLRQWLLYDGSMTKRLKKHCTQFTINVLSSKRIALSSSEQRMLNLSTKSWGLLREVYICCNDQPWIYGRTIIPYQYLNGSLRRIQSLKNIPLGKVLFTTPNRKRSAFEIARFTPNQEEYQQAVQQLNIRPSMMWARRSIFSFTHDKVLLAEVFLPDMVNFIKSHKVIK